MQTATTELAEPGGDVWRRHPADVARLVLSLAALAPVGVGIWLVVRRRFRLFGTAVAAAVLAGVSVALLQGWLDRMVPPSTDIAQAGDSWITGAAFPSGTYLASFTAAVVVLGAASTHR